jgi:hypothetical protein
MRHQTKVLKSAPNLDRATALSALKAGLRKGARIQSFTKQGNQWVAQVRMAEFPPKKDDEGGDPFGGKPEDSGDDFGGSDDESDDSEDKGGDDKPKPPKKDKKDDKGGDDLGGDSEVVDLLKQILEAVGGGQSDLGVPPPPGDLGLDEAGPEGPPKGGPEGGPDDELAGLVGEDIIPTLASQFKQVAGKLPTVTISSPDSGKSIRQAKAEIEQAGRPYGYKVTRAVRENGKLRVVASVR